MPWSWSNPTPDDTTSAKLSAGYQVNAANIGPLVNALLDYRNAQAQQEQKRQDDMMKNISGAMSGIAQQQSAGQLADFEQASLQGGGGQFKEGSDLYDSSNQQYLDSLLGGMSPEAKLAAAKFINQQQEQALKDNYLQSRTNAADALANQRWTGKTASGGSGTDYESPLNLRRQQLIDQGNIKMEKDRLATMFGVQPSDLPGIVAAINAYKPGDPNSQVPAEPENTFPQVGAFKQGDATPGELKQSMIDAVKAYQSLQGRGSPVEASPGASAPPAGGGPTDAAIAHLRAHPELAADFDEMYGSGMAIQYITP